MEVTVEEVTVLQADTQQGEQLQEWELPGALNLERAVSTLDGPIWSKYSIALTYPDRLHFQCALSKYPIFR